LLRQIAPNTTRLGILVDRWWMDEFGGPEILQDARARFAFDGRIFLAESLPELRALLSTREALMMDAWYVPYTGLAFEEPRASLAAFKAIGKPVMYPATVFTEAGGLLSYQQKVTVDEAFQVIGRAVALILDGVPPGEIPVERPKSFELAVNFQRSTQLGLPIPEELLKRADRVILGDPRESTK
jgi:putative ABC transport system substrate-binding protein